jgi:hypothetical protein
MHAQAADVEALPFLEGRPGIGRQHLLYLARQLVLLLARGAAGAATDAARSVEEKAHAHGFSCLSKAPGDIPGEVSTGSIHPDQLIVNPLVLIKNDDIIFYNKITENIELLQA